jgi:hypothetical protein
MLGACAFRMHDLYPRPVPWLRRKSDPGFAGEPRLSGTALLHTKVACATGPAGRGQGGTEIAVISRVATELTF